jgi:hypothetical protein
MGEIGRCEADLVRQLTQRAEAAEKQYQFEYQRAEQLSRCAEAAEAALTRAREYTGLEAWACPLCTYENGKYIKPCSLHAQLEAAEARLREHDAEAVEAVHDAVAKALVLEHDLKNTSMVLTDTQARLREVEPEGPYHPDDCGCADCE